MPRRPDPETGLIPEADPFEMQNLVAEEVPATPRRTRRMLTDAMPVLDYPTLERQVMELQTRAMQAQPAITSVEAERDFARGGVNLHIRQNDPRTYHYSVIENITWRAVQPGEEAPRGAGIFLDERNARFLAEQLSDFNPQVRRMQTMQREYDEARNELRSVANQLEEVRNHNTTLQNHTDELMRQIRWLERELRDANRERREQAS